MQTATLIVDPSFRIGAIDPRLYGSFVEHMGRVVYGGIFDPGHPTADDLGFRGDVMDHVRELDIPILRYPGGNFVSGYNWEDGVGPVAERPRRLDLAWRTLEPNTVGLNEFVGWAGQLGAQPMLAVNLGTRGVDAARNLVEYCNHPGGSLYSDLRIKHGVHAPHGIKLWCLGNEMDGPWQIGQKTAHEYGRVAAEAAKAMRLVDPSIEIVACGSSDGRMATFPDWEATVLTHTYELVDYISLHDYYDPENHGGDLGAFLASSLAMEDFITTVAATCDHVRAKTRSRKHMYLAFDEWNIWYHSRWDPGALANFPEAPVLLENDFTLADALALGGLLIALLRHVDRVKIACLAQLVNVLAPIRTEPGGGVWRQTTYYPFQQAARYGRGATLRVEVESPTQEVAHFGRVPVLETVATFDEERDEAVIFALNRDQHEPLALSADLRALAGYEVIEHLVLAGEDVNAVNTLANPDRVLPRAVSGTLVREGSLEAVLPRLSWNVIRLRARDRG